MDYNIRYIRESFEASPYNVSVNVWFRDSENKKVNIRDFENIYSKIATFSFVFKYVYFDIGSF